MLIPSRRTGFTLVELMMSIGMMSIIGAAIYQLLITTQRLSRAQLQQADVQARLRAGVLVIANELRELSPADLLVRGAGSLTYRAARGLGFLCQADTPTQLRIARSEFSGFRDPQAGRDSLLLYLDNNTETTLDDAWLPLPIIQVSAAACPGAGHPGLALTIPSAAALASVASGTPLRVFEIMEIRLYRSEGSSWLGARSVTSGEAIQPVVGPLTETDGFHLDYLDGDNQPAGDADAVRSVRVTLRTSGQGASGNTPVGEELRSEVALRNLALP
jgi:prepilin-type N-terminal cleavage/methylation domain-containing protein